MGPVKLRKGFTGDKGKIGGQGNMLIQLVVTFRTPKKKTNSHKLKPF